MEQSDLVDNAATVAMIMSFAFHLLDMYWSSFA